MCYVMDAFGASHRKHASTYGAIQFAKKACAGPLLSSEIDSLKKAMGNPEKALSGSHWWGQGFIQAWVSLNP